MKSYLGLGLPTKKHVTIVSSIHIADKGSLGSLPHTHNGNSVTLLCVFQYKYREFVSLRPGVAGVASHKTRL